MAFSPEVLAALDRLANYYDGKRPYNAATNPGGFQFGGHRVNFEPALEDVATAVEAAASLFGNVDSVVDQKIAAAFAGAKRLIDELEDRVDGEVNSREQLGIALSQVDGALAERIRLQEVQQAADFAALASADASQRARLDVQEGITPPTLDSQHRAQIVDDAGSYGGLTKDGRWSIPQAVQEVPSTLDSRYKIPIVDETGVVGGLTHDNRWDLPPAKLEIPRTLSSRYSQQTVDDVGTVQAIDKQGRVIQDRAPSPFMGRPLFVNGRLRFAVRRRGEATLLDIARGEFDSVPEFEMLGNYARWFGENDDGTSGEREACLVPTSTLNLVVTDVVGLILYGQSLSVGASTTTVINVAPLNPGRAVMFNGGVRVHKRAHDYQPEALDPRNVRDWVDLSERLDVYSGETRASVAAQTFLASQPANVGVVAAAIGVGGQPYEALKKGTQPFSNLVAVALRMVQVAILTGKTMSQIFVYFGQGESNGADSEAAYAAKLLEIQADVQIIKRITGQTVDVIIITDQISVFQDIRSAGPTLAQLSAARNNPSRVVSLGPKFFLPYSAENTPPNLGGLHLSALGQAWHGGFLGRAMTQMKAGTAPLPKHVTSAVRSGTSVAMTVAGGSNTALRIDTATVSNPGGDQPFGIRWQDDGNGNAVTVTGVTVSGNDTVNATLSATPTGSNGKIHVAGYSAVPGNNGGPNSGPRNCIADSSPDTVLIQGASYSLAHRLCHQIIPVT